MKPASVLRLEGLLEKMGFINNEFSRDKYTGTYYMLDNKDNIIELNLSHKSIRNFAFLEQFPFLQSLLINGNDVVDLSTLKNLKKLTSLSLEGNGNGLVSIDDLAPLSNLTSLKLGYNSITDISCLKNLVNLTHLNLRSNRIADFTSLSGLIKLEKLDISLTQVNDLSFITGLKRLRKLNISETPVKNISALIHLSLLEKLDIAFTDTAYFGPLEKLNRLKILRLGAEYLDDVSFITGLKNLEELSIRTPGLKDLSITDLPVLKSLELESSHLTKVFLKNLPAIEFLGLGNLELETARIEDMKNLSSLYISNNKLSDIQLNNLPRLRGLDISKNKISNIGFLNQVPAIASLNLSENELTGISLSGFNNLTYLDITYNKIEICDLQNLGKLETLLFANNPLQTIHFNSLSSLIRLNLAHSQVKNLMLKELDALTILYLNNSVINDFSFLDGMKNLRELDITGTKFSDYSLLAKIPLLEVLKMQDPPADFTSFSGMVYLKQIYLSGSKTESRFVTHLGNRQLFPSLESIGFKTKEIIELEKEMKCILTPSFPGGVNDWIENESYVLNPKAQEVAFRLRRKKLSDISFLTRFTRLEVLDLRINEITDISVLQNLGNLRELHLYRNQITHIPPDFFDSLPNLNYINLARNPIKNVPQEIFDRDENIIEDLRTYLASLQGEKEYLHQAKMILVGNGEVGKSSIRIKLLDRNAPLPKKEERTQGLDIAKYTVKKLPASITNLSGPINFDLSVWDFGGQGRYREVQHLFCSRKALYLFVTSVDDYPDKEDYIGFEYWLSMARAYGYDKKENWQSPVIHVLNKYDLGTKPVNEEALAGAFNNIHDFVKISCETLYNFDELEKCIRAALPKISKDVFSNQFSKKWFAVKEALEKLFHQNHISLAEYLEICYNCKLNDSEANLWLDYLDRVGSIIYFRDNDELNDFIVLNPLWVKDCIYKVLDSPLIKRGILEKDFLPLIWNDYTSYEHANLLSLMLAYKFCYPQQDNQGSTFYIVPSLLPQIRPALPSFLCSHLYELRFDYTPFLPAGTVNKLMVELNQYIYQDLKWKNGCILHLAEDNTISFGEVTEDWENKAVHLRIGGYDLHAIYILIRSALLKQLDELKKTKLLDALEMEIKLKVNNSYVSPKTIIDLGRENDFPFLFRRSHPVQSAAYSAGKTTLKKVFISYSHDDIVMRETLQQYLVNLERDGLIEIWQDGLIKAGENWDSSIRQRLEKADICILLLSQPIIASTYTHEVEFKAMMENRKKQATHIIPVLLRDCDWKNWKVYPPEILEKLGSDAENFKISNFQFLPLENKRLKAISKWTFPEDAWLQVADAIREFCKNPG